MFVKTFGLGIQLFLPLAIIGVAVLIPIHKDQGYATEKDDEGQEINDTFLSMTVSNLKPGSSVFWYSQHLKIQFLFIF